MWEGVKEEESGEEEVRRCMAVLMPYACAAAAAAWPCVRLLVLAWLGLAAAYQVYSAYSLSSEINLPDLGTTYLAIRS